MNGLLSEKEIIRKYQQTFMGILFLVMTPLSILPGIPFDSDNPIGWWHSVSQSYYANSGIVMIGFFVMIGILAVTFRARNILEKICMVLMGISSIGVVMFPHAYRVLENTGFFQVNGVTSINIHFIFAGILFVSMCCLSLIFALIPEDTEKKHQRNVMYLSNWVILLFAAIMVGLTKNKIVPEWTTLVMEFIMFTLFGADLLCCAGKIPFLR